MDTWAIDKHATRLDEVKRGLLPLIPLADGVTFSGGEPFDQPEALLALLRWLREVNAGDVLVYSGYPYEALTRHLAASDGLIDAIITDPFRREIDQTMALRGSDNQRLFLLTARGREKFAEYERQAEQRDYTLDVMFDDETGEIFMAGIPARGDLQRLAADLEADGHHLTMTTNIRSDS
jgi:anaerobic ribonucleoside-triphosphate reductase activating protein